jgi:hypothetical protein
MTIGLRTIIRSSAVADPLGGPDGENLCDRVQNALCESCRVLISRGVTGQFEIRKPGIGHPCIRRDIERAAGLTVYEPDDGVEHFATWRAFDQDAVSRSAVLAHSAREGWGWKGSTCQYERLSMFGPAGSRMKLGCPSGQRASTATRLAKCECRSSGVSSRF